MFHYYELSLILEGLADWVMTPERAAALVIICTAVAGFCIWAVTAIVTDVIRKEMKTILHNISGLSTRLTVVETKIGIRGLKVE